MGSARELVSLAARDQSPIVHFVSRVVWQETERNLRIKAPRGLPYFLALEDTGAVRFVDQPEPLVRDAGRIVVAKDAPIVAPAIEAKADWLVSYDRKHLLRLADLILAEFGISVAVPEDVLRSLGA